MFMLDDTNMYLFELSTERNQKVVNRYMKYVYFNITDYCTYSSMIDILNKANKKVNKFLRKDLTIL